MKNVLKFLKNHIHLSTIVDKGAPKKLIPSCLQKISSIVYNHSQDASYVMIAFNALAIFSSHLSQRNGLIKSNRENKEYLIEQENKEMWLDAGLSILPSIAIKKYVERKIVEGKWTTASQRQKMLTHIPTGSGASRDDIYETYVRVPIIKKCKDAYNTVKAKIATNKYLPKSLRDRITFERIKPKGRKFGVKFRELQELYDELWQNKSPYMRNGSAIADIGGFKNGMELMATLSYSILAATVIMPILKNILTNISYKKQLAAIGETPENIRRKKRFAFNETPVYTSTAPCFAEMSASLGRSKNTIYHQNLKNVASCSNYHKHPSVFSDIAKMNTSSLKV